LKPTRRDFLKTAVAAGAGLVLGPAARAAGGSPDKTVLAAVGGKNIEKMVRRAFDLVGGVDKYVSPGDCVVVKPNASFANPDSWGNNTNPEIVSAVCRLIREAGARKVLVLDYPLLRGAEALELNGVAQAVKEVRGARLSVLGKEHQFREIPVPGGEALKKVAVAREVLDADCLINVPVAKAHDAVAASIGLKNLMGVIWDRAAFHTMMEINRAITDLALVVKPKLTLVDMTRVMTTNGPKGPGEVDTPNLVTLCTDPVAADAFALSKIRFNGRKFRPKQLKYLRYASAAGLGEIDLKKLSILKEEV
jgi:uncharacterized protein (DUF362 family)